MKTIQSVSIWRILSSLLVLVLFASDLQSGDSGINKNDTSRTLRKRRKTKNLMEVLSPIQEEAHPELTKNHSREPNWGEILPSTQDILQLLVERPILIPTIAKFCSSFYKTISHSLFHPIAGLQDSIFPAFMHRGASVLGNLGLFFATKPLELMLGCEIVGFLKQKVPYGTKNLVIPLVLSAFISSYYDHDFISNSLMFSALLLACSKPEQVESNAS